MQHLLSEDSLWIQAQLGLDLFCRMILSLAVGVASKALFLRLLSIWILGRTDTGTRYRSDYSADRAEKCHSS
jgi:hypothetical protein